MEAISASMTTREIAMILFARLFVKSDGISKDQLFAGLQFSDEDKDKAFNEMEEILLSHTPLFLQQVEETFILKSRGEFAAFLGSLLQKRRPLLTQALLETLAYIAYNQPVRKSEIDRLRGADSEYSIAKLSAEGLIRSTASRSRPGNPLLYQTTKFFLEVFNLKDLSELPPLSDFVS